MKQSGAEKFEVVWPLGPRARRQVTQSPAIADLNGKVIAEVWDRVFRGDEMFPRIREAINARFPGATFVSHEAFGDIFGWNEQQVIRDLPGLLAKHGVDAVIVGVGA